MEINPLNLIIPDFHIGPKLQDAINLAAGTSPQTQKAAVWIPANYPGNDTYTNPNNVPVFDMRGAGSQSFGSITSVASFNGIYSGTSSLRSTLTKIAAMQTASPAQLRSCPMCLGVWTASAVSFLAGFYNPVHILTIAGVGHVLYLLREKYLPCDKCKVPEPIPFKFIGN